MGSINLLLEFFILGYRYKEKSRKKKKLMKWEKWGKNHYEAMEHNRTRKLNDKKINLMIG